MEQIMSENAREAIKEKLRQVFDGKIVRKDLTKKIKEGANVPVYVLEFLLGQYCCSDDDEVIEKGVQTVKRILADNFVRPDEAQKILAKLRSNGSHTVIDMITVKLDIKRNRFFAEFSNLDRISILLFFFIVLVVQLNDAPDTATEQTNVLFRVFIVNRHVV